MDEPGSTVFIIPNRTKMPMKGAKFRGVKSSHRGKKLNFLLYSALERVLIHMLQRRLLDRRRRWV